MLRIIQTTSAAGAKTYYSTADYYTQGQELEGRWCGKAAGMLGLAGRIDRKAWDALCDNRRPVSGETLTLRQKAQRRIGYDFNFHVPKSVSLLYGLTGDERVLTAFRSAVDATMRDMQAEMKARVRKSRQNEDRLTGNMLWGEFIHFTARPVGGVPDPHLHAHCFVFNSTFDFDESRWKAGQFADLKRDAPYFQAVYESRLARNLCELGVAVERTRQGWEVAGIPASARQKFSRRTTLIEEKARVQGITDAERKGELGAKTRERKIKALTLKELRDEWASRLSDSESDALRKARATIGTDSISECRERTNEALSNALDHCLERNSVVSERRLLAEAMKRAVGAASPELVKQCEDERRLLKGELTGEAIVTTPAVLAEERAMIDFARNGRGTCRRLGYEKHVVSRDWLSNEQRTAVQHVLTSPDRVILIRGAAGAGKTAMMQEAAEAIESLGHHVFTFAPSADASRGVLRQEGFASAETVARLLCDPELQERMRGQVMWIDEAGQLGTRTMSQVFKLADRLDARVILSGDRRQHGSVERGAALRLLEEEAGLVSSEIREIRRQQGQYKAAVKALSEGRTAEGFKQLDELHWIHEVDATERYKALAQDYVNSVTHGNSALVISPTHREGEWITDEVRTQLKEAGSLGPKEHTFTVLENTNLTEAERRDAVNYSLGDVLVFHQNAKKFHKGERVVVGDGPLPLDQAARFQVFRPVHLRVAVGDVIRITHNGRTADDEHRLDNRACFTVKDFDAAGNIVLTNGWKISKDFGHVTHGYVVTSHAAQARTVDEVFIGQSSASAGASSREQFYVSVSRGKRKAVIYTDDKEQLLEAVSRPVDRLSATELTRAAERMRAPEQVVIADKALREQQGSVIDHER